MKDISYAHPTYCYMVAHFINELKQNKIHYLLSTTFIHMNSIMNKLVELVFLIQTPVAPVSIIYSDGSVKVINP